MNSVQIVGRISNKGDIQGKKVKVIRLIVAVNRNKDEADFIPVKAFGSVAETIDEYTEVGDQVILQGHIQSGAYDNDDGDHIYTLDIIADRMEFGAKKQKDSKKGGKKGK